MEFGTITYDDLKTIGNLQPDGWPDIVHDFEFYINSEFCCPVKTESDNKIVGIGASIVFGKTGWIAHIIVDENYRKRGIGYSIVKKLLTNLKRNSVDTCLLIASDSGQPVYEKAGFRIISEYSYFKREKIWTNLPVSKNVMPYSDEYYSMIISLDIEISGENREELLKDYMENSKVYIENNDIKGYYLPDLGEGLIFADTIEAGLDLMKVKYSGIDKAVIPSENSAGIEFLKENGFIESQTKGTRMILGKDVDWKPENIFSRIGGNFG